MGKGIDAARPHAPSHAAVLDDFKDQLLIVAMKRLQARGDTLVFPIGEVDNTGQDLLAFAVRDGAFHFELRKKQ